MPGGLTTRGRCLLAAGLAAALCALVLDERDLLRIAAFVVVLPLLATFTAGRARLGLDAARELVPARSPAGSTTEVHVTLRSHGRLGTGDLLLEDGVPPALGPRPRFVMERLPRQGGSTLRYHLQPRLRGIHPIGPLVARITDPFGLAEFERELAGHSRLVVTPVVAPLRGLPTGGGLGSGEQGAGRLRAGQGEDDVLVRSYRQGDDLRKVHWRSTARQDELMVRVEERPWRGGTGVLLDHRAGAHRGTGEDSSLEYAVSLAASICVHLQCHGQRVALSTAEGRLLDGGREGGAQDASHTDVMLDALAALVPVHRSDLVGGQVLSGGQDVVAVLGAVTPGTIERFLVTRPRGLRSSAVLLDVGTWGGDPGPDPAATARLLSAAGWSVTLAGRGQPMTAVWDSVCSATPVARGELR